MSTAVRGSGSSLVNAAGIAIRGGGITVPFAGLHLDGRESDALAAVIELASRDPWSKPTTHPRNALAIRIGRATFATIVGGRGADAGDRVPSHDDHGYRGQASADLTFVYNAPRGTEGMIVFRQGPARPVSHEGAARLTTALALIARLAAARRGPLLYLYAPSSPPPRGAQGSRGDGSREQWRWETRDCIRFAAGMPGSEPRGVLDFHRDLLNHCAAHGFGFHLADRRIRRRGGRWFELMSASADEKAAETAVRRILPLSVVGPARVGTIKAVTSHLAANGVGVAGASANALGEMALLNLVLALPPRRAREEQETAPGPALGLVASLEWVGRSLGTGAREVQSDDAALLADYLGFLGAPRPPEASANRRALWVAWEAPASGDALRVFAEALRVAMSETELVEETELQAEHVILRCVSEDLARGRCKLSVGWQGKRGPDRALEFALSLSIALERACKRHLTRCAPGLAPSIEVQVSPHESLLGRWHSPAALI